MDYTVNNKASIFWPPFLSRLLRLIISQKKKEPKGHKCSLEITTANHEVTLSPQHSISNRKGVII